MDDESKTVECPYCHQPMQAGYFMVGGGIWFGKASIPPIANRIGGPGAVLSDPIHTIVGKSGFMSDVHDWPRPGFFCRSCLTVTFKMRPFKGDPDITPQ